MTNIAFTGDVAFTKHFSASCDAEDLMSSEITEFLSSSDYTVVNVEGAVSSCSATADKPLTHANPPQCVNQIKKINGNIWNLANNHAMDCGEDGLFSTLDVAKQNNFKVIGAGINEEEAKKPLVISNDGGIGIIAVTYFRQNRAQSGTPGCFIADDKRVKEKIKEIKKTNRWCIVVSHVGQEFSQMPLPFLRKRYKRYLKYGADIVVGHHPHVVQNYEKFGKKIVFYSLGNFIFDTNYQRIQSYTNYGMLLKISFTQNDYSWDYMPVETNRETMKISKSHTPVIFRNITPFEYGLLWPLAAKQLSKNEHRKNTFHHPEYSSRSWLGWFFKSDIKKCKKQQGRGIMLGRLFSIMRLWKLADKDIVNYLKETNKKEP